MKIKRISLSADEYYGHFSGQDFEFDTENLVVVHGPNESGKSTFLNLVRDLLFGIKKNSLYAIGDRSQKMQMRAVLELDATRSDKSPQTLEIVRRKGNKDELTGHFVNGETIDEDRFKRLIGLPDRNEYENVFGFTQAILSGELQSDKSGTLAQVLYSTAFRAGAIDELKKQLKDESDNYFTSSKGTSKVIYKNWTQLDQLIDKVEEKRIDHGKYTELEKQLETQTQEIDQLEHTLTIKNGERNRLEKLQKSRSHYRELKRNRARLSQIDASQAKASRFPVDGETEYTNLVNAIAENKIAMEDNAKSIAQTKQQIELHKRQCHEGVLSIAAPLHRLNGRKSGYDSLVQQLPERRDDLETTGENVETLLKRISPNAKLETVIEWSVTDATLAELERLQQESQNAMQEISRQRNTQEWLQSQLAEQESTQNQLAATSRPVEIGENDRHRIEQLIKDCLQYEIACEKLREKKASQNSLQAEIKELLVGLAERLGLGEISHADDDTFDKIPVIRRFPDNETIRKCEEEIGALQKSLERLKTQSDEYAEKLAACEREIAKLDSGGGRVPTREDVTKERANRDRVWQYFRRRLFESSNTADEPNEASTPDAYEQLVRTVDEMADLRFDRVNEVRQLESLLKDREAYRERIAALHLERQTAQKQLDQTTNEWLAIWPGCRAELVKRPAIMFQARELWEKRQRLQQQLHDVGADANLLQLQKNDFERQATVLAAKFQIENTPDQAAKSQATATGAHGDWSVSEAKILCQLLKNIVEQDVEYRRELSQSHERIAKSRADLKTAADALQKAIDNHAALQQQAVQRTTDIGLPGFEANGLVVERLLDTCKLIRQVQQEHQKYRRLQKSLGESEARIKQFEEEAAATLLTVTWDKDAASLAPVELLAYAMPLLEQSEKALAEMRMLETQAAMLEENDRQQCEKLAKRQAELQALFDRAGVSDSQTFLQLATVAAEREQCLEQMRAAEQQLLTILETTDWTTWESELEKQFGDSTSADATSDERVDIDLLLEKINLETQQLREQLDQLRETKGGTDRDLAHLRQSDGAAKVAEQVEFARQELLENINRFVPQLLALRTLEYSIEKFERERQPETLGQIRDYFSAMTGGRYVNIGTRIGQGDSLVVFESNGREKTVDRLSTGTREQLHLAVRLAYIDNFRKTRESLPVVLDDVLVNFDPARQIETLKFLGELSKQMQIIFLTCHDATLDLARQTVPTLSTISL